MNYYLPVLIVVISNTFYHICSKSAPQNMNTYATLSVTYLVGTVVTFLLYFVTRKDGTLLAEYQNLNWASFGLGVAIVGLEVGFMLMYKVGWPVSTAQIVTSAFLAIALIFVGFLIYKEAITVQKVAGIAICLVGLYLLNK